MDGPDQDDDGPGCGFSLGEHPPQFGVQIGDHGPRLQPTDGGQLHRQVGAHAGERRPLVCHQFTCCCSQGGKVSFIWLIHINKDMIRSHGLCPLKASECTSAGRKNSIGWSSLCLIKVDHSSKEEVP